MSFVVIWDTCTIPEYYTDLHKVMALPEGMLVRYDYKKKYFDSKSLSVFIKLYNGEISEIEVIHFYGEVDNYVKGSGNPPRDTIVDHHVPFRVGKVIRCNIFPGAGDEEDDKVVYDIKIGKFPNVYKYSRLRNQMEPAFREGSPFLKWHTYIEEESIRSGFLTNNASLSLNNWERAVELLQKRQFEKDSFWNIEGPFDKYGNSISGRISHKENHNSLIDSVIKINDEEDLFFIINNRDPLVDDNSFDKPREIKMTATGGVIVDKTSIPLRPYSSVSIQIRGITTSYWKGDIGGLELDTICSDSGAVPPIGPHIQLSFIVNKEMWKIYLGLLFGVLSAIGFVIVSKLALYEKIASGSQVFDFNIFFSVIGLTVISSILLVLASVLLRKEIKFR